MPSLETSTQNSSSTPSLSPKAASYKPTHPDLFQVQFAPGNHKSKLVAIKPFAPNDILAEISGTTPGPKRWSSVQISKDSHIELNSDLLYMNHSCDPSVNLDVSSKPWKVRVGSKGLQPGQDITFFYPCTEWDMAQPFECNCNSSNCLKTITGAKHIPIHILQQRFINNHILELKQQQNS